MILKVNINKTEQLDQRIKFIENVRDVVSVEIEELKPLPEVRKIETGLLKESVCIIIKNMFPLFENKRIEVLPNCRDLFEDIRTQWDFSSIPVKSVIEIITKQSPVPYYGRYLHVNDVNLYPDRGGPFAINFIESIRIIELPKDGE